MTRIGVSAALVAGCWVRGDVDMVDDRVMAIGLSPAVGSKVVVSGFIDRQINGFAGVDFRRADEQDYGRVGQRLLETGVTEFHPTLFSMSLGGYLEALSVLREIHDRQDRRRLGPNRGTQRGANACGMHLEGPFLSPRWRGAHDADTLIEPDRDVLDQLLAAGPVSIVTLAPELPGALNLVPYLVDRGVTVSIGHTDADAATCHAAFDAGATMVTHWGNAHRRFSMRDPGPAAASIDDDRVTVGVIADGIHIGDDALRMLARSAAGRIVLVTDAILATQLDPAEWNAKGTPVTVSDGAARLVDGTLAGSVATMDACVRHMIDLGVPSAIVLDAAGGNRLRPGSRIGAVIMDDNWHVVDVHL